MARGRKLPPQGVQFGPLIQYIYRFRMYISFVFQQAHCAGTEALLLETPQAGVISVHLTVH